MTYSGGYLMHRLPLLKTGTHRHTSAIDGDPVGPTMRRAVNLIQAVERRINTFVLDTMREAFVNGETIGEMPSANDVPLPKRATDGQWEKMTKEQRGAYKAKLADIHSTNASLLGKRESFLRKLQIADELRDRNAIWFPHNLDFRGRIYPLPQDLNPQGDDIAKSLLMFGEGKPLGRWGYYWLAVSVANVFGEDKLDLDARVEWVMKNTKQIVDSAERPLEGQRFWTTADEPWSALALCREWLGYQTEGNDFVSHAAICLDATCSGMQHLSAVALDPIGALMTNLTNAPDRQDLYSHVAKSVVRMVERDAARGKEAARNWLGKVDRKTVKRAVMTTPYGVTARGMRDQLIVDKHTSGLDGKVLENADYLRDKIVEALSQTVAAAKDVMAYLQDTATALADEDIPLSWTTPAGMRVQQAYYNKSERRIRTVFGQASLWEDNADLGLNKRKQALAAAPNWVHANDASHLAKVVTALKDDHHVSAFTFVHDSFGVHAANVDTLNTVLRREFVEMYREDQLARFEEEVRSYAPSVELPERPTRGDFDLEQVLEARFFFS